MGCRQGLAKPFPEQTCQEPPALTMTWGPHPFTTPGVWGAGECEHFLTHEQIFFKTHRSAEVCAVCCTPSTLDQSTLDRHLVHKRRWQFYLDGVLPVPWLTVRLCLQETNTERGGLGGLLQKGC